MPTDLIEALAALATDWDDAAPIVTFEELTSERSISDEAPPTSPEITVVGSPRRPRRWLIAVAAAAAVALVIVAVTVLRSGEPDRRIEPPVGSEPTTSATSLATPTTKELFAAAVDQVSGARAALQAFTAVVTVTNSNPAIDATGASLPPDVTTRTNRVTLLSDGSLWSEGDLFQWSSFDPSTSTARNATVGEDGVVMYQEVVGWADNSVPVNILFGVDPFVDVYGLSLMAQAGEPGLTIEEVTSPLGREAWRIAQSSISTSDDEAGGETTTTSVWDIDRETGVVVAYRNVQVFNGVEQRTESQVTELTTETALPAAFPGGFPDGATVNRSGDPNGFLPMTLDEAAAWFGGSLYVPADFSADSLVRLTRQRQAFGSSVEANSTMIQVEITRRVGFTSSTVTMIEYILDPGAAVPPDASVIDGLLCFAPAGQCTGAPDDSAITSGALDGKPSVAEANTVTAVDGGRTVIVRAATAAAALELANSMTLVGP
ncbi:MAG: hypothetical protein HY828_16995 [Actinobacteria bacterium]|nr:hypothetical protein [Actinomycetota bacterium]